MLVDIRHRLSVKPIYTSVYTRDYPQILVLDCKSRSADKTINNTIVNHEAPKILLASLL